MNRIQKSVWNPLLTHSKPVGIAIFFWLALFAVSFWGWLEDPSSFAFCLGLAVGLSLMQFGFIWGQYRDLWFRFFMENRDVIFKHGYDSKRRVFTYLVAFAAAKILYWALALGMAFPLLMFSDLFPRHWGFGFSLIYLLIVFSASAFTARFLSRRGEAWGKAKLNQLTDYSYVFGESLDQPPLEQK